MVQGRKIVSITIPNYIREIELSKSVRPKYWEWDGITIKCKSKKLLQKYINQDYRKNIILNNGNVLPQWLKSDYVICGFRGNTNVETIWSYPDNMVSIAYEEIPKKDRNKPIKYYMVTRKSLNISEKVIANPSRVNKPRIQIINGQNIYNHTASPFTTGKIFDAIKLMYYKKFKTIEPTTLNNLRELISKRYPIMVIVEVKDTVKNFYDNTKEGNGRAWDVGNRTDPYMKTFLDFLTHGLRDIAPIIEDDDRLHVSTGNNSYFTPIEEGKERSLIFHFYQDDREVWKQYQN